MSEIKNFFKYTGYFHDGNLNKIIIQEKNVELFIESAQMDSEDLEEGIYLTMEETLKGILILKNVNDLTFAEKIKLMLSKEKMWGQIFRLKIFVNKVSLQINWPDPKDCKKDLFDVFEIECEEVHFYQHEY